MTGPAPRKSAPFKSKTGNVITEQGKQLECLVKHYFELFATQNVVTDVALATIPDLPVMEELNDLPTKEELSIAINCLASGKALGSDGIPTEALKSGKSALLEPLHKLLCRCGEGGHISQVMRDTNIVTLYKNKGDRSDCNSYRREGFCPGGPYPLADPCIPHLPRVPVWLPHWPVDGGHGVFFFTAPTPGEMPGAADATFHRLHRPYEGI